MVICKDPKDKNFKLSDADLVVLWQKPITNLAYRPKLSRIDSLTYCRIRGYKGQGFLLGSQDLLKSKLPEGGTLYLASTTLNLMDAEIRKSNI